MRGSGPVAIKGESNYSGLLVISKARVAVLMYEQ